MNRSLTNFGLVLVGLVLSCQELPAHYLWVAVGKDTDDGNVANIYFEEAPAPGDGHYLDHFLGTSDVWVRTLQDPSPEPMKASEVKEDENRWMRVPLPEADESSIDSYGKFGVYEYGETKVLLHYYARNLKVSSHDTIHELGQAEQMDLDLVPHDVGQQLELKLLWKGKPVPERMIFVRGPKGYRKNIETDAKGRILLEIGDSGKYSFRSSLEEPTPGEEKGEAYALIRHNITLLMNLPFGNAP